MGAVLAAAGVYVLRVALWTPFVPAAGAPSDGLTRAVGVVHVHTTLSDGGGTPEEVIAAARATGLSFVALTDHNHLDGKRYEGYREGVLVLVGIEASTTGGHGVGLGIPDPTFRFSRDPLDTLEDVRDLGGISFAAHPTSPVDSFRWTGWDLPGPWGLELLNGDTQWRSAGAWRLARTGALYAVNPGYALLTSLSPPLDALARWDDMLQERDVAGIVGADAHSRVVVHKDAAVRFPSYESLFTLARNHVLLERPLAGRADLDGAAVLEALARGRSYVALDALAPAGGFSFEVTGDARRALMGDTVAPRPGLRLRAGGALPPSARVAVLRNGLPLAEETGRVDLEPSEPGVYRVEVRLPGWDVPWILSNPIYVFDAGAAAERARAAAWPSPRPPPTAARTLDSFDATTTFHAGHDTASSAEADVIDPAGGIDGAGAARLRFRLAAPGPDRPHTFCALVSREPRDLSGHEGLVFSIKGDGTYRIRLEVRDENPASIDEGTEWWFASVKTTPEWRRVAVPFSRLRSINPRTDGRLDLDRVRALVFVLDRGEVKVGTEGTIWIDDLGVY